MAWFREAKFGMFIHWGPYAALGGEWQGRRAEPAEWVMKRLQIPVLEYRRLARQFHPTSFVPEDWVTLAKDSGMKYVVFTAKHHDGFAMFKSDATEYDIVDWAGLERDPVRELAEECRRQKLRFGFYYSHREDWNEPFAYGNTWDFNFDPESDPRRFERDYIDQKVKPQLRELLSNYGDIDLVWFDRGIYTREQAIELIHLVRELQPDVIINGRVGNYAHDLMGDYQNLSDNALPPVALEEDWESPQTLNNTWGYSRADQGWKSAAQVVERLVTTVSRGGNYLLNVGPDEAGKIPQASENVLREVGDWLSKNGESIYGTTAGPLHSIPWGYSTVRGGTLYLHVFEWPDDGILQVRELESTVTGVQFLSSRQNLEFEQDHTGLTIAVPTLPPDPIATVLALSLEGAPHIRPILVKPSEGVLSLDFRSAITEGRATKRYNRVGKFHLSGWRAPQDRVVWHLDVPRKGTYQIKVTYAARQAWHDQVYEIGAGRERFEGRVASTGGEHIYRTFPVGSVTFSQSGEATLMMRPAQRLQENLLNLQRIDLVPTN